VTVPNALSGLRLLLAPALLLLAWFQFANWFIPVLILAFVLDLVDGPIARRFDQVSAFGARIDSWADFSIYVSFVVGAWWLWPDVVRREWPYIASVAASVLVPVAFGVLKFGKPTSLHTWMVKAGAVTMAPSAILLFLAGPAWPFHAATVICIAAAIEESIIVWLLPRPRSNVKSVVHVLRDRRGR
jgi:CDP-diacylglycerol--glycerol-3-phosphate 3-phosphatidyltransferase